MTVRPSPIHVSSLSRRELHRRRRRRWVTALPLGPGAAFLIAVEASLVVAAWAARLF